MDRISNPIRCLGSIRSKTPCGLFRFTSLRPLGSCRIPCIVCTSCERCKKMRHGVQSRPKTSWLSREQRDVGRRSFARSRPSWIWMGAMAGIAGLTWYSEQDRLKRFGFATTRCSRVAWASLRCVVLYKMLSFRQKYVLWTQNPSESQWKAMQAQAYSACHTQCAHIVLHCLRANGGIFVKLGQHLASAIVLPLEWTLPMRVLQDQCQPSDWSDVVQLIEKETGRSILEQFESFDVIPKAVGSLAQVHHATLFNGQQVAVKVQHPLLEEYAEMDMKVTELITSLVAMIFPEFAFSWLAEEMRHNLPKEMDFYQEAANAMCFERAFSTYRKTSLYIPKNFLIRKRLMVLEWIDGGRVDDHSYLRQHHIDPNQVSLELSRIFATMIYEQGTFHADPHLGNILIRPKPAHSRSRYNFEVVLLDHGLKIDLEHDLRLNYARLWLSFVKSSSPEVNQERRKYAKLVGNIEDDLYAVFEAAITGKAAMQGSWDGTPAAATFRPTRSTLMQTVPARTQTDVEAIRRAFATTNGLIFNVMDLLRRVPRRLLMVLKTNDLVRANDRALQTTHSELRNLIIVARSCARAVYKDNLEILTTLPSSLQVAQSYIRASLEFYKLDSKLRIIEFGLSIRSLFTKWYKAIFDSVDRVQMIPFVTSQVYNNG